MKTVVIVGGTGFLGRAVVTVLETAGWKVRVLSRRTGFDASHSNADPFRGADAVVNLAGIKREAGSQTFEAVHVELVRNLVASMKLAGVKRLIHISVVVARSAPDLPYHDSKWRGEEIVRASGLDFTILRPGVIYGDGDDMLHHLALMIRTSPIFPVVGKGTSFMRPVDVRDVAGAVAAALQMPSSNKKTYDIVGPDRIPLRNVVQIVAKSLDLPITICPTPVALMRIPVRIMEAVMTQPLSTRAQLVMLAEGLDGDPAPARRELNLTTAPFTTERLRPLLTTTTNTAPMSLRLLSSPPSAKEITGMQFWTMLFFMAAGLAIVFGTVTDRWLGMTVMMSIAGAATMFRTSVRSRLKPTLFRILAGVIGGGLLYAMTMFVIALLPGVWPDWEASARAVYSWRNGHSPLLTASTLILIVLAEEMVWRGVVTRYLIERYGRIAGIVCGAAIYALAHWATFNPLLLAAAFGCGIYWGWLYAATDDLVTPTVSHLLWDLLLIFLFPVVR